jgi:hypothetical protein
MELSAAGAIAVAGGDALAEEPKAEVPRQEQKAGAKAERDHGISIDLSAADGGGFTIRGELYRVDGGKRQFGDLVRVERVVRDGGYRDTGGVRLPFQSDGLNGDIKISLSSDSTGEWAGAVNAKSKIIIPGAPGLDVGTDLEISRYGSERMLADLYGGINLKPFILQIGYGHMFNEAGDDQDLINWAGFLDVDLPGLGKHMFGTGGRAEIGDPDSTVLNFILGKYDGDMRYRIRGQSQLMGDFWGDLVIGDQISRADVSCPIMVGGTAALNDLRIFPNMGMKYMTFPQRAPSDFTRSMGLSGRVTHNGGLTRGTLDGVIYPVGALDKLGADIPEGFYSGFWLGGGVKGIGSGPDRRLVGRMGYRHGCFDIYLEKAEGEPGSLMIALEIR